MEIYINAANICKENQGDCNQCLLTENCPFSEYANFENPIEAIIEFIVNNKEE